jgi:hypothetical protein
MKGQLDRRGNETDGYTIHRRGDYGRFGMVDQEVRFDPIPKRPMNYLPGTHRLRTWAIAPEKESGIYGPIKGEKLVQSADAKALQREKQIEFDQPDWDDEPDEFGD